MNMRYEHEIHCYNNLTTPCMGGVAKLSQEC